MRTLPRRKASISRVFTRLLTGVTVLALLAAAVVGVWGYMHRQWDGKTRFTVIVPGKLVQIKSFDPDSGQGIVLTLPESLEITATSGRGVWLAGVIFEAGKEDWAADSVANTLGIAYTATDFGSGWWDAWQWQKYSRTVTWKEIDLATSGILEKVVTPDGVEVVRLGSRADDRIRDWFVDQAIAAESLGVVITNTTTTSGLGADAGRVAESMGIKLRELRNDPSEVDVCVLRGSEEMRKSLGGEKLRRVFGCTWEDGSDQDLELVLGTGYQHWKYGD